MNRFKMKIWGDFQEPLVKVKSDNIIDLEKAVKDLKNKLK